jgi:hypothetical protein
MHFLPLTEVKLAILNVPEEDWVTLDEVEK